MSASTNSHANGLSAMPNPSEQTSICPPGPTGNGLAASHYGLEVREYPLDCLLPAPGNRVPTIELVKHLLPSILKDGQKVPGFVYRDPELVGMYRVPEGNLRAFCLRIKGNEKFKAIELEKAPTRGELRRLRAIYEIRENRTIEEICQDVEEEMRETGCTQGEAAEALGLSASWLSRLKAQLKRLLPELHELRGKPGFTPSVMTIIATMPSEELQRKLADKLLAIVAHGGVVKKELTEKLAAALKGPKTARNGKTVKGKTLKGVAYNIPTNCDHDTAYAELMVLAKAIKKSQDLGLPMTAVPSLLQRA